VLPSVALFAMLLMLLDPAAHVPTLCVLAPSLAVVFALFVVVLPSLVHFAMLPLMLLLDPVAHAPTLGVLASPIVVVLLLLVLVLP
jgi:hypothetical protein